MYICMYTCTYTYGYVYIWRVGRKWVRISIYPSLDQFICLSIFRVNPRSGAKVSAEIYLSIYRSVHLSIYLSGKPEVREKRRDEWGESECWDISIHLSICASMYQPIYFLFITSMNLSIRLSIYRCIYIYVYMYMFICIYMYIYIHMYMYIYMYIYIYICIYMYDE